jgi:tRNA threonylcarbamoyladenosine biosynthesis protein TsaB
MFARLHSSDARAPATHLSLHRGSSGAVDMKLLALDTATETMAVALADGGESLCVNAEGGARASATLLPTVMDLLARRGLRPADLDAIAFGQGPGAFTGLRTAVSVAQGMAFGARCPVLPIDSLLIVADDARAQAAGEAHTGPFDVWVAMDARLDEAYAAAYRHDGERWQLRVPPALCDLPRLAAQWSAPQQAPLHMAGSAITAFADRLPLGAARRWPQVADRAAALLRLARQAWADGLARPAHEALPVYLRDKVALTTAERAAQRLDASGVRPS